MTAMDRARSSGNGSLWAGIWPSSGAWQAEDCRRGWQTATSTRVCVERGLWPGNIWGTRCVVVMGEEQGGIRLRDRLLAAGDRPRLKLRLLQIQQGPIGRSR